VEVHSFVDSYRRFGAALSNADADRYVDEMAFSGELVGIPPELVPRSMSDLRDYFASVRGLAVTPEAIEGMRFIVAPPMPLWARPLWAIPVYGAFATLPRFARALYNVPAPIIAPVPIQTAMWGLGRILQRVLPGPPAYRAALERLAAS
jgi:uncharacterized protein (DUF2236 family)